MVRKNMRVRKAMLETGVTQAQLAEVMRLKQPMMSVILTRFELSAFEQADMVKLVRDIAEEAKEQKNER